MIEEYDFDIDTRQSKVAILLLIWKYYKIAFRQFFALIAVLAVSLSKTSVLAIWGIMALVTIIVFTMAILAYFRFYFHIENDELIIQKGVFKKSRLNIPFDRIQTVNFEQNIILQVFDKYKVEIDTAGSSKKEFSFDALDKDVAIQLREKILLGKKKTAALEHDEEGILETQLEEQIPDETIFKLDDISLLKIGLTENHIRAGAWVIAIVGYAMSTASEVGIEVEERIENLEFIKNINPSLAFALSIIPALILLLVLISIVRTYLKYYQLKFERMPNGFKIFSGLFNRREYSAPDTKIQKVAWGDNPIRRIFGIFILWLKQARSSDSDNNKSISIPVNSINHVHQTLRHLYKEKMDKEIYSFEVSRHYFTRRFVYFILFPSITAIVILSFFSLYQWITIPIIYFLYFSITTWVQYRKTRFLFNDFLIQRKKGIYGNYFELIPWYKIQAVDLVQSIYQRRYNLANVIFYTAAGEIKIPYIGLSQAQNLRDFALYKAESTNKEWM